MKRPARFLSAAFVAATLFFTLNVAASGVDPTFNAVPSLDLTSASARGQIVQPDGKVLIYGHDFVVGGVAKGDIARLNVDGSLDTTFDYCGCVVRSIGNILLAPDGKIVIAGSSPGVGRMIRLFADGTVDPTFSVAVADTSFGTSYSFTINAVLPDGKVYATRREAFQGNATYTFFRYNADGTFDSGFSQILLAIGNPMVAYARVVLLPDGKFYLAKTSGVLGTGSTLQRYNPDGSADSSWEEPEFSTGSPSQTSISDMALAPDGSLVVTGRFNTVNGAPKPHLVRILSGGNVDINFPVGGVNVLSGLGVEVEPNGKVLFSGVVDTSGITRIHKLNADGSTDGSFQMDPSVTSSTTNFDRDSAGRLIFFGLLTDVSTRLVRLLSNGTRDTSFDPVIENCGRIYASAVQNDGKVLLAGQFTAVGSMARNGFARVNADGSLDPAFDAGTGFSTPPRKLLVQTDGKILAVGSFTSYNGISVTGIVRIHSNGSIDSGFNVATNADPFDINLQADGRILIAGGFSQVNGMGRTGVARLNSDGTLDPAFNPVIGTSSGGGMAQIVPQADGKIMIAGGFSGVNGFNRTNVARLNSDGSLDQTYNSSTGAIISRIWIQPHGKYILGFGFPTRSLGRRNTDGSIDPNFTPPILEWNSSFNAEIHELLIRPDGSLLIGGRFDLVGGTPQMNITRLAPNGMRDPLFLPGGADQLVRTLSHYSGDKVIAGGDFAVIGDVSKSGVARLTVQFRAKTAYDFDGDGRSDVSVFRPSTSRWYELRSSDSQVDETTFGAAGDIPVPADFDGDGKTDEAVFRPSTGTWWYQSSITGTHNAVQFGQAGDVPRPSDFDGDGRADFIVYRPSNSVWYRIGSTGELSIMQFGIAEDKPLIGDFDGDGKSDVAIYRPSTGTWWYAASGTAGQFRAVQFGISTDIPSPADYDGDGRTDIAVYRPSDGVWYILKSSNGSVQSTAFGIAEDRPVPADFDGDGQSDIAVFRPSTGNWYLLRSTSGFGAVQFGIAEDNPIPGSFIQ